MEHTPKPWTVEENATNYDHIRIWGCGGKRHIGYVNKQQPKDSVAMADARLIAVAPELLSIAKMALPVLETFVDLLKRAIAKAEGK